MKVRCFILFTAVVSATVSQAAHRPLFVAYPPDGHTTDAQRVYVLGAATVGMAVRVDGEAVETTPSGYFAKSVSLELGANPIVIQAGDDEVRRIVVRRDARAEPVTVPGEPIEPPAQAPPDSLSTWQVAEAMVTVRMGPGDGYSHRTPLPEGTRVVVDGWQGDWARLRSGGWILRHSLRRLEAAVPAVATVGDVSVGTAGDSVAVVFRLDAPVPFELRQEDDRMAIVFRPATARTSEIRMGSDPWIDSIDWRPLGRDAVEYVVRFSGPQWGYETRWAGSNLVLALRRPPAGRSRGRKPLSGLRILLDPGHGGETDTGSRGPTGLFEKDLALGLVRRIGQELERRGATVERSRDEDRALTPEERVSLIEERKPTLALSLHFNSVGDGQDPLRARGVAVYWFQPQSRALARELYDALVRQIGRPPDGISWRSLALTRPTVTPAVLVEVGYLTNPAEFEWLTAAANERVLGRAISDAIGRWWVRRLPVDETERHRTAPARSSQHRE
jgi:N-acetylmuramoyl-L-alanine amidase